MTNYIPHSDADRSTMMKSVGIQSMSELFADIPKDKLLNKPLNIPDAMPEMILRRHMMNMANKNKIPKLSFVGAGCYNHFIPSTVNHIISRSEFFTAYTPYQPEVSQGSLQVFYEFQTMITELTGMDVANASMYEGSSALAEAATLACGIKGKKTILISKAVHPEYRDVVKSYMDARNLLLVEIDVTNGITDFDDANNVIYCTRNKMIVTSGTHK